MAKKRHEQEVAQLQESQPPKKKTKQGYNYGRRSKGDLGRANPFPTLDLSAKVIQLSSVDLKMNRIILQPEPVADWWTPDVHEQQQQRTPKMNSVRKVWIKLLKSKGNFSVLF